MCSPLWNKIATMAWRIHVTHLEVSQVSTGIFGEFFGRITKPEFLMPFVVMTQQTNKQTNNQTKILRHEQQVETT